MSDRAAANVKAELCDETGDVSLPLTKLRGSQTLLRGFDILDALTLESRSLRDLARSVGLTRTTTYRLASALQGRGYLIHGNGRGYCLGPRLLALRDCAERQIDLVDLAADALRDIVRQTGDTANLAVLDQGTVLFLRKVDGSRRLHVRSRVGERHDAATTALGKALLLDKSEQDWRAAHDTALAFSLDLPVWASWKAQMLSYVSLDYALAEEENFGTRSLAAPIRNASGKIVGAISITSLACNSSGAELAKWAPCLKTHASCISNEMGWSASS